MDITNFKQNLGIAEAVLAAAQTTPQGRARLALASALGDTPGWFTPLSAEPAPNDFSDQESNQYLWDAEVDFPFVFAFRAELEARAGGNVSWNTGVDYRKQLHRSANFLEVWALYQQAGLSLEADLDTLNDAPRISADPGAVKYLSQNIIFNGDIQISVLTMHTTGDGMVINENEEADNDVVHEVGNGRFLRQTFVSRAGHCSFTPAETLAAVSVLLDRLGTGDWHGLEENDLNGAAAALGPVFSVFPAGSTLVPTPPG